MARRSSSDAYEKCRKCGAVNKGIHTLPYTCWDEHQVVPNDHLAVRYELTDSDLREIGEFTRENVLTWMESHKGVDWFDTLACGGTPRFSASPLRRITQRRFVCNRGPE